MQLPPIHPQLVRSIKILSTVLISGAIALEIWNLYVRLTHHFLPDFLPVLLWLGRIALISHFIEGIIAGIYAPAREKNILRSGIYTFFTGTVGLLELLDEQGEV